MVGHSGAHSISHWLHPAGSRAMQFTELGSALPPPMTINRRPHALALVWGVALMHPSPPCRPGHEAGTGCIVNARVTTAGLKANFRTHLVTKRVAERGCIAPAYRAIRKEIVAAMVADTETTAAPAPTPNSSPAVIVSGTAGRASTSSSVYSAPYAGYLHQRAPSLC